MSGTLKLGPVKSDLAKPDLAKSVNTSSGATETNKEEDDANESIESMGKIANVGGALLYGILGNLVAAGIPTMFSVIFSTLKFVGYILYWIFIKIVPFLVLYVGIPLFILGILLGLLFFGGHLIFLVVFFVGIYFYIRGAFNLRIKNDKGPSTTASV